jgi:hypothetical protein
MAPPYPADLTICGQARSPGPPNQPRSPPIAAREFREPGEPQQEDEAMASVHFYELDSATSSRRLLGTLMWDGQQWTVEPDSQMMRTLLTTPLRLHGRGVSAKDEPKVFLDTLPWYYRGSYFWAEPGSTPGVWPVEFEEEEDDAEATEPTKPRKRKDG